MKNITDNLLLIAEVKCVHETAKCKLFSIIDLTITVIGKGFKVSKTLLTTP